MASVASVGMRRAESSEETESTTTASRRGSDDSDSGVNLSERDTVPLTQPGLPRQKTLDCEAADNVFKSDPGPVQCSDYSSSVPMAGLPLAGAMMGLCLGGPVGLLAGVKLGGVAAVGGSFLGYTGACVIKEQKEMRSYIDDHYKAEPDLCITPREEARLSRRQPSVRSESETRLGRRQTSVRSDSVRQLPIRRARSTSETAQYSRHLPSVRRPRTYQSACNSPVVRRKLEPSKNSPRRQPRPVQPPNLQPGQFRRLGDLSEEEQRSVVALIAAHSRPRLVQEHCGAENRRKQFARQHERERRAASLPDVLEEDSHSTKS